jgi:ABC-type sugar transport system ATPase subunit
MNLIPVTLREANDAVFANGGGWHMALDGDAAHRLRRTATSDCVILGFRPEHVELIKPAASSQEADTLAGRVTWTEMRGDSHIVTLTPIETGANSPATRGAQQVTIEVPGASPPEVGAPIGIRIRRDLLNLFDPATGTNLLRRMPEGRSFGVPVKPMKEARGRASRRWRA